MSGISEQPTRAGESAVARRADRMTGKEAFDFIASNIGNSGVVNKPILRDLLAPGQLEFLDGAWGLALGYDIVVLVDPKEGTTIRRNPGGKRRSLYASEAEVRKSPPFAGELPQGLIDGAGVAAAKLVVAEATELQRRYDSYTFAMGRIRERLEDGHFRVKKGHVTSLTPDGEGAIAPLNTNQIHRKAVAYGNMWGQLPIRIANTQPIMLEEHDYVLRSLVEQDQIQSTKDGSEVTTIRGATARSGYAEVHSRGGMDIGLRSPSGGLKLFKGADIIYLYDAKGSLLHRFRAGNPPRGYEVIYGKDLETALASEPLGGDVND